METVILFPQLPLSLPSEPINKVTLSGRDERYALVLQHGFHSPNLVSIQMLLSARTGKSRDTCLSSNMSYDKPEISWQVDYIGPFPS